MDDHSDKYVKYEETELKSIQIKVLIDAGRALEFQHHNVSGRTNWTRWL